MKWWGKILAAMWVIGVTVFLIWTAIDNEEPCDDDHEPDGYCFQVER